jgi:hypothetical protein
VSWLKRLIGGGDDDLPGPVILNVEARRTQLQELEAALDKLVAVMAENTERMSNPGWRGRVSEYRMLSGEARLLRAREFTREEILDLAFEIRPVFTGEMPDDVRAVEPLQADLMRAAEALQEVLPGERSA